MKSKSTICTNALCREKAKGAQKTLSGCCGQECEEEMQERLRARQKSARKKIMQGKSGDMDFHWFSDGW